MWRCIDGLRLKFDEDVCQWCRKLNAILVGGNTSQNYTSIDANNALENSNCSSTDADNRNEQQFNNVISMRGAARVSAHVSTPNLVCVAVFFLFLGDVLQRHDPGQCYQAGAGTRRQQVWGSHLPSDLHIPGWKRRYQCTLYFYWALFAVINQQFSSSCLSVGRCSSDRLISPSGLVFLSRLPPSLCLALSKRLIFHLTPVPLFSHTQFSLSQFSPSWYLLSK